MELITYPFSMFMGAAFVLLMVAPWAILAYYCVQEWLKFITDRDHEFKTVVDEYLDKLSEPTVITIVLAGVWGVCVTGYSLLEWVHHDAPVLITLIRVMFANPVGVSAWLSPVLLPVVVVFGSSFGLRKLYRVGSSINKRLHKVEDKVDGS